jgi:hypothetical protein
MIKSKTRLANPEYVTISKQYKEKTPMRRGFEAGLVVIGSPG